MTYIHGRGNVHESQLGIHTWSTLCQRGHHFNEVFIKDFISLKYDQHEMFKSITLLVKFVKYKIETKWLDKWRQKWNSYVHLHENEVHINFEMSPWTIHTW